MNRKLILKSDFRDYYDFAFDSIHFAGSAPVVFERFSKGGMLRPTAFQYMKKSLGLTIPTTGNVRSIIDQFGEAVIYYIPHAHRGEGKVLLNDYDLLPAHYLSDFAARYIRPDEGPAVSYRLLQIGKNRYTLRYQSQGDPHEWRSNVGPEVNIQIVDEPLPQPVKQEYPLQAIDFVRESPGSYFAVDFNTAPGMVNTGIEDILRGGEVVELIREFIFQK